MRDDTNQSSSPLYLVKLIGLLIACVCIFSCLQAQQTVTNKNILIVYFSRTNNTKAVAQIIHKYTGGKLVALELEKPYPADYRENVQQVIEENEKGYLPPLKTKIDSIDKYYVVFVGFPTWDMKLPPPMKSFLHQYNLSGKTVVPFNTNAGYGEGSSFQTVKELCPESTITKGFVITGGEERAGKLLAIEGKKATEADAKVKVWLKEIKIL